MRLFFWRKHSKPKPLGDPYRTPGRELTAEERSACQKEPTRAEKTRDIALKNSKARDEQLLKDVLKRIDEAAGSGEFFCYTLTNDTAPPLSVVKALREMGFGVKNPDKSYATVYW